MNKVGLNIRRLRKKQNLTQVQLSELVNVSSQVVSNWERGYSVLAADDLAKLIEVFGVPGDKILGTDYLLNEGKIKETYIEETEEQKDKNELISFIRSAEEHKHIKLLLEMSKNMKK